MRKRQHLGPVDDVRWVTPINDTKPPFPLAIGIILHSGFQDEIHIKQGITVCMCIWLTHIIYLKFLQS